MSEFASEPGSCSGFCVGCDYSLRGLTETRCPECGLAFDPNDPGTFIYAPHKLGWIGRVLLRASPWPVTVFALFMLTWQLWELRLPQHAMIATWYYSWYGTVLLVAIPAVATFLLRSSILAQFGKAARRIQPKRIGWVLPIALVAAASYAAETRLPLRLAFELSRSRLEALADAALAGASLPLGSQRAGLYVVRVELGADRSVFMYTKEFHGAWGFARVPAATT